MTEQPAPETSTENSGPSWWSRPPGTFEAFWGVVLGVAAVVLILRVDAGESRSVVLRQEAASASAVTLLIDGANVYRWKGNEVVGETALRRRLSQSGTLPTRVRIEMAPTAMWDSAWRATRALRRAGVRTIDVVVTPVERLGEPTEEADRAARLERPVHRPHAHSGARTRLDAGRRLRKGSRVS